jgi:hypothetical protein
MANTYTLISSVTVGGGGASNIEFTSIPATYTDLVVKTSLRNTSNASTFTKLTFNGSTSSLSYRYLLGNGSAASSGNASTTFIYAGDHDGTNETANTFANTEIYIPNYAGSGNKSVSVDSVTENNATAATAMLTAGLWANSAAITQVTLTPGANNFAQYSTAYLYGISNA